jgi:hypothetical protein
LIRKNACSFSKSRPSTGGLDPSRYNERQCAFIVNFDMRIPYCESFQDLFRLAPDRIAIIGTYARFKADLQTASLVRLNAYLKVGADFRSTMPCNPHTSDIIHDGITHSLDVLLCGPLCTLW